MKHDNFLTANKAVGLIVLGVAGFLAMTFYTSTNENISNLYRQGDEQNVNIAQNEERISSNNNKIEDIKAEKKIFADAMITLTEQIRLLSISVATLQATLEAKK